MTARRDHRSAARHTDHDVSDWRHNAACRDDAIDPETFWPIGTSGPALRQIAAAKTICARCPVRTDCLEWALAHADGGVWGGLDENERRRLKRRDTRTKARAA